MQYAHQRTHAELIERRADHNDLPTTAIHMMETEQWACHALLNFAGIDHSYTTAWKD